MKICLAGRGDITNKRLWSGTPKQLNEYFSASQEMQINNINWQFNKLILSFYSVIISKLLFIWETARDPLLNKYAEKRIVSALNKQAKEDEFIFLFPIIVFPKKLKLSIILPFISIRFLKSNLNIQKIKNQGYRIS